MPEHFDVLIVGAGLSGIDAAVRLQERCPDRSFAIVERRARIGGTWDLFRYPGIRSDSDVTTLGFPFRPWKGNQAITAGGDIREYILETARETGVMDKVRTGRTVTAAAWSSDEARWTVTLDGPDGPETMTCGFLYACTGYYNYDRAHVPDYPGADQFGGEIVVPQFWPEDLDWSGKRIVVIGSGATAVTLVPTLAETAQVTMLQRSPSYVVTLPSKDKWAGRLQRILPLRAAHRLTRWKNIGMSMMIYQMSRRRPQKMRSFFIENARKQLPEGFDVEKHFVPDYDPWDQRLCVVPQGDLFRAIRKGTADVVTERIDTFTETGIRLQDGRELPADIIVSATGLSVQILGGATLTVDGAPYSVAEHVSYKGAMLDGLPNAAMAFGYTNASWTLKCDQIARYVCRLLNHMKRKGHTVATPRVDPKAPRDPFVDLSSGYVKRASGVVPSQGRAAPWRVHQNYIRDVIEFRLKPVVDGAIDFRGQP
ncbi:flavin-containing monooxygenase [Palleronia abyssalis]|uniref:FAD-containing monooxygenase EthA n=1 Tax=Palleronia abyssalis TaxID=1501240 RepID=A0A2R8BR11_9RHOB|nr:NAD(P)/FAD-dependent oxidoreductase [Palleronia abyssalis]SPJ22597.1 FAD-containing monooxygenase EthA [Palleronia abyssalis]